MEQNSDKRDFMRVAATPEVRVTLENGSKITGKAEDVSVKGVFVETPSLFPVGTRCQAAVMLDTGAGILEVHAMGTVARVSAEGMAIEFDTTTPEDLEHLQKLVLYNAVDTDRAEAEIRSSIGLRRHD
jgi:hypothetical protein